MSKKEEEDRLRQWMILFSRKNSQMSQVVEEVNNLTTSVNETLKAFEKKIITLKSNDSE